MNHVPPRILIVDDEAGVRSALRRTLRKESYEIRFAASAVEALEMLKEVQFDLIISDHLMPGMTGLQLLERCRLLYPDVGRIVLTGHAEMETAIAAINDGAVFRFLTKPWDDEEVKLAVHLALRHVAQGREKAAAESTPDEAAAQPLDGEAIAALSHIAVVQELDDVHPGIRDVNRDASGAILIDDSEVAAPR